MGNTNELDISQPDSYCANIFSKLQYDDLKKAHTESVIPVCDNDYNKIKVIIAVIDLATAFCSPNEMVHLLRYVFDRFLNMNDYTNV